MSAMKLWTILVLAGVCEVAWAISLKYSQGLTQLWPSVASITLMLLSFVLLAIPMRYMPAGTTYAVWTGIGAVGTAVLGMVLLKEPVNAMRVICIVMIVAGIIGLELSHS